MFQYLCFQFFITRRIIWRELGFAQVVAKRPAAHGKERRALNTFGYGKAGNEAPPLFQIGNEVSRCGKEVGHLDATAQVFFQRACKIPFENRLRCCPLPAFDKGAEEVVMVRIDQRIALALSNVLFGR